jgi:soluble lytic murein transglycosylase-like protein
LQFDGISPESHIRPEGDPRLQNIERLSRIISLTILLPLVAIASTRTASGHPADANSTIASVSSFIRQVADAPSEGAQQQAAVTARTSHRSRRERLNIPVTPQVQTFLQYYTEGRGRRTAEVGLARAVEYREMAEKIFREEGVPTDLIWLAQVESNWQVGAKSHAGACGMWQFVPATGERYGLECDAAAEADERLDVEKSTRAAAKYLRFLGRRYDGDWLLAMGAYNCGEGTMDRAIEKSGGERNFWTLARNGALPNETANYVPAILATIIIADNPSGYGLGS